MQTPISIQTLIAIISDMDRSVDFYQNVVGVEFDRISPYWSSFTLSGIQVGLHPAFGSPETNSDGWIFGYEVADVMAMKEQLAAGGVELEIDCHDVPGGVIIQFRDPDGNILQPIQRGVTVKSLVNG